MQLPCCDLLLCQVEEMESHIRLMAALKMFELGKVSC